jgi:microcystin-dependent protein
MPSANGVYSLPPGYLATTGATILASQHNPPLEDIGAALTLRLSRDGTAAMTGPLQLAAGTVTVPGAVFSTDASAGFYKTTNGIGVSIAGVKVAEFVAGGVSGARVIGELVPYSGSFAPPLFVFPYGQTLSRVTYAALWAFAQTEIAIGNSFYNNGDGSTTFGILDLRGRVVAAPDNMGGAAAARLTGYVRGTVGGEQAHIITPSEMASHFHGGVTGGMTANNPHDHPGSVQGTRGADGNNFSVVIPSGGSAFSTPNVGFRDIQHGHFISPDGGNVAHNNVQPTLAANYILFVGAPA